jgi:glycosyltransferase involved in cell wall biosynthesis
MKENKKLLQINSVVNRGSTGRIAEGIGNVAIKEGWESYIIYGRDANRSSSILHKVGSDIDIYKHVVYSRLFDRHGFASVSATFKIIDLIKKINPNIIQLHNIHGYYINIEILFKFLKSLNKPIIWTLHDCWAFTGHCAYYSAINCEKWKTHCHHCPSLHSYPESLFADQSAKNFSDKKKIFSMPKDLTIITPSQWLANEVSKSFLKERSTIVINNGININIFQPKIDKQIYQKYNINFENFVIGVASEWSERKGLSEFIKLRKVLHSSIGIVLVGLTSKQIALLPKGIIGILKTENVSELVSLYSAAMCFVNPTKEDNFPTTNLESISCGTPVVTYQTGGSSESVDHKTGIVVERGDIIGLKNAIQDIKEKKKKFYKEDCVQKATNEYDENRKFIEYIDLYNKLLINYANK